MKKMKILRKALAFCLLACMIFSTAACGTPDADKTDSSEAEKVTYAIEVTSQGGMALADVGVYIYTDSTQQELVWFAKTDASGKLTFTDVASDSYVAVLKDVPVGYKVAESYAITGETTRIELETDMESTNPTATTYHLGDVMQDFTVTAADGTEYTLSKLLSEKEAVVLNFWFMSCDPCRAEFPYLQQAYETFGEQIAVLALNPVDTDAGAIAQFGSDNGLTFPMAPCDPAWEGALELTGYPTTVVVDRFGTISLIHRGSIPDAQVFTNIFAYFADENYQQGIVEDVESLPQYEVVVDPTEPSTEPEETVPATQPSKPTDPKPTEPKPTDPKPTETVPPTEPEEPAQVIEVDASLQTFDVTVKPGKVVYCNLTRISKMILTIKDADAYVIYNDKTYNAENGTVSLTIQSDDVYSVLQIAIGNKGSTEKTFTVKLSNPAGTWNNPYTMKLGQFTVNVASGNDQGVYYDYVATESGILTVQCLSVTPDVDFTYSLYNLDSGAMRNLECDAQTDPSSGVITVSVQVKKGQTVRFNASALPDDSNKYPKATFEFLATFEADAG